jgi:hypothetical protein
LTSGHGRCDCRPDSVLGHGKGIAMIRVRLALLVSALVTIAAIGGENIVWSM